MDDGETESSHENEPQLALSDALDLPGPNTDWRVSPGRSQSRTKLHRRKSRSVQLGGRELDCDGM